MPLAMTVQPSLQGSVVSTPSMQRLRAERSALQVQIAYVSAGQVGGGGEPSHVVAGSARCAPCSTQSEGVVGEQSPS
jgi:hypothetical protein